MLEAVSRIAAEAGAMAAARCGGEFRRWEKVPGHPVCDIDLDRLKKTFEEMALKARGESRKH